MRAEGARNRLGFGPQAVILLLALCLAAAMAIEPTRQLLEQRDHIAGMSDDLRDLRSSNRRLDRRIARLNDPDYLEQQAREQIGLVRPGEVTYRVMPPARSKRDRENRGRNTKSPAPAPPGFIERLVEFIGLD